MRPDTPRSSYSSYLSGSGPSEANRSVTPIAMDLVVIARYRSLIDDGKLDDDMQPTGTTLQTLFRTI